MNQHQLTNFKHKIDFLISNDTSLSQPIQTIVKRNIKYIKCNQCKKRRRPSKGDPRIFFTCYRSNNVFKPTGYKTIDDFIKHTQCNTRFGKMESVPYDQFKDIEFIAEGGFSRVYKATWIGGPKYNRSRWRNDKRQVVLKKLNNSKNITSKELNEVIFYCFVFILMNPNMLK